MRRLEPPPVPRLVYGDPESQPPPARSLRPRTDDIPVRPDVVRVPGVVRGIPRIEAVVMVGQGQEELRSGAHIEVHQLVGLPVKECPLRAKILVTEPRGVPVMRELVVV